MFPSSTQSPSKKYRPNDLQKSVLQQSFRSKTQKAIELINKHEEEKYNFLKTLNSSKRFINLSPTKNDQQYFSIIQIPQISIQQSIKVQLLPYTDQLYKIQNPFFSSHDHISESKSMAIQEEDETSSQGTVPIQNSQIKIKPVKHKKQHSRSTLNKSVLEQSTFSVLETNCKLRLFIKNYRGASSQLLIYFEDLPSVKDFNFHSHKFMLSSEKIININMEEVMNKKWVYLRVKSKSQLSMFTMRVEKESFVKKRVSTEMPEGNEFSTRNETNKKLPQLKGSRSLKVFRTNDQDKDKEKEKPHTIKKSGSLILKSINDNPSLQMSNSDHSPSSKRKNKEILQRLKKQQLLKKKQEQQKKHEQILQKKTAIEIVKEKQLKLRGKALEIKRLVQQYKVIYEDQKYYRKFLQPKIAVLLILPRFNKACRQMIVQRQNGMQMARKTRALTRKFSKIIKNKYKQSIEHVRNRKLRELVGVANFTTLFAKILHKNSTQNCHNIITATINLTKPGQIINHCFDYATTYRRSIRHIQKTWLTQYSARITMFQKYIKDQVQILLVKYPYFKYIHAKFITENIHKKLAYKYIADESSKLKYLFEDYTQRLEEIKDFNEMNNKIIEFNNTALKKRQKPLLEIPKTPCRPSSRYFRNISSLKSMIRGWFEVEYRKWSKVNKVSSPSLESSNKKGQVSPRKLIKQDASINSIDLSSPRKQ